MKTRHFLMVLPLVLLGFLGIGVARSATTAREMLEKIQIETALHTQLQEKITDAETVILTQNQILATLIGAYREANFRVESYQGLGLELLQLENFDVVAATTSYQQEADTKVALRQSDLGVSLELLEQIQSQLDDLREQRDAISGQLAEAVVNRIIDGDTLDVMIGETRERVRLIGVDAPERFQSGFQEAADFVAYVAPIGSTVWLQEDGRNRDHFGRLRRYIWLETPRTLTEESEVRALMLNAKLLEQGHAVVQVLRGDNPVHEELFRRLE